jgi:hypothetical protein
VQQELTLKENKYNKYKFRVNSIVPMFLPIQKTVFSSGHEYEEALNRRKLEI